MVAKISVILPQLGNSPSRDSPDSFDDDAEDMMGKLPPLQRSIDQFSTEANALAQDVNDAVVRAEQAATAATAAAATAGAELWSPTKSYALGEPVVDPVKLLLYRKRTAASVSTTPPRDDPINWRDVSNVGPAAAGYPNDTSTVLSWDLSTAQVLTIRLGANRTLQNPTNMAVGTYIVHAIQDATGGRVLSFGTAYAFIENVAPEIDKGANRRTVFSMVCDGTTMFCSYLPVFAK